MNNNELQTIEYFRSILKNPDAIAQQWKDDGKKVVGFRCMFVPEEIIWAADMLPYPLYGTPEPVKLADAYIESCSCEFIRNIFDHALKGRYDFLDGLILSSTCDVMRRLPDLWNLYIGKFPIHLINNPQKLINEKNRGYFREELLLFKSVIETWSGKTITDEKLFDAIELYNETRELMRKIYSLREEEPPRLSGSEALDISMAVSLLPKEEANKHLKTLLKELDDREVQEDFATRIMVTGSIIEEPTLIKMIEEEGGAVVSDDLCTTTRLFWHSAEHHDDPIEALYQFHNKRPLCACMHPYEERFAYINELIQKFNVEGVINFNLKYCHPSLYEAPLLNNELARHNIPMTHLEIGHDKSGHGQLRTRIQAFIEMIEL